MGLDFTRGRKRHPQSDVLHIQQGIIDTLPLYENITALVIVMSHYTTVTSHYIRAILHVDHTDVRLHQSNVI